MTAGLRSSTVRLQKGPDPLSLIPAQSGVAWVTEALSLVAGGPYFSIDPGTGPDRFPRGARAVAALLAGAEIHDEVDLPGSGPVVFGSWTFDEDSPGSRLLVPSVIHGSSEEVAWTTTITFGEGTPTGPAGDPTVREGSSLAGQEWMRAVERALAAIASGTIDKVVLARKVSVEAAGDLDQNRLARLLAGRYPGCFTFCFEDLVGASPELLVRRVGDLVDSVPLAGSARRGATEKEDIELGRELKESHKNLAEHALAVQTVMEKLSPWCSDLIKEPEPSLLLLANVQHLSTKVQGRLTGTPNALTLAGTLHPTAAVCGVPQAAAMDLIRALESFDRGRYAGPVGWMDHRGDGEWALALRCALIRENRAEIFAGAGVVAESDPQSELEETSLKLQAILSALGKPT